jgi:hypothetical protein
MTKLTEPPLAYTAEFARFTQLFTGYARVLRLNTELNEYLSSSNLIDIEMRMMLPEGMATPDSEEEQRTILFWQAQECLRIFERNGYKIIEGPHISIEGEGVMSHSVEVITRIFTCTLEVRIKNHDWKTKTKRKL